MCRMKQVTLTLQKRPLGGNGPPNPSMYAFTRLKSGSQFPECDKDALEMTQQKHKLHIWPNIYKYLKLDPAHLSPPLGPPTPAGFAIARPPADPAAGGPWPPPHGRRQLGTAGSQRGPASEGGPGAKPLEVRHCSTARTGWLVGWLVGWFFLASLPRWNQASSIRCST